MPTGDDDRAGALRRVKLAATLLLVGTAALFVVARHFEPMHWAWGYVASFAAAATVGGLADWYAVVALFRRPLGLPIPHTAIIPRNHQRIAENLGTFVETNFLAPEAVEKKLGEVDFAAQVAEWLSDRERSAALAGFVTKLLPQTLTAIDQSGLRVFLGERVRAELERVELAPLAAGLLSAVTETGRHQRLLNELLGALDKVLTNEETLAALREKIRKELPALFNLSGPIPICCARSWLRQRPSSRRHAAIPTMRCAASSTASFRVSSSACAIPGISPSAPNG
jgi:uncharacterized membrane-anchored protein YjiN (DUF445 family)